MKNIEKKYNYYKLYVYMVDYIKLFEEKYNTKYRTKVKYEGSIKAVKSLDDYFVNINLTVLDDGKVIYNYCKEFKIFSNKKVIGYSYNDKTLSMDNWHFIDIVDYLDDLL